MNGIVQHTKKMEERAFDGLQYPGRNHFFIAKLGTHRKHVSANKAGIGMAADFPTQTLGVERGGTLPTIATKNGALTHQSPNCGLL